MKRNKLYKAICLASLVCGMPVMTSCESFLEEKEIPRVNVDFYSTQQGVDAAAIASYGYMRFGVSGEYTNVLTELGTDLITGAQGGKKLTNEYNMTSASGTFWDLWKNHYKGINTTNLVIGSVPASKELNEAQKNLALAEMYFLRSYFYFDLVQQFGRIPLVLQADYEVRTEFKRASVAEVYKQIITDLRFSSEHLREKATGEDQGKATRYAAAHLLSKIYLTRCSAVTEDRGQKATDADSAYHYAMKVIDSPNYKLLNNFSELWNPNNGGNAEVIFAVQFTPDLVYNGNGNKSHLYWASGYEITGMKRDLENGRPYTFHRPTNRTMFDLYDRKNDSRFYKSFKWVYYCNKPEAGLQLGDTAIYYSLNPLPAGSKIKYTYIQWNKEDETQNYQFYPPVLKYYDPNRASMNEQKGVREWVRMRLGETYLLAAEAAGRKGDLNRAAELINVVRKRAAWHKGEEKIAQYWKEEGGVKGNMDDTFSEIEVKNADLSKDFVGFMLDERGRELLGEYMRWEDLVRCEKAYEYVTKFNPYSGKLIKEYHTLRPIPQKHIDRLSPRGTDEEEQNVGYY